LANLYDRYANALDPFSEDRSKARQKFKEKLADLHDAQAPTMVYDVFKIEVIKLLKAYLKRNAVPYPSIPKSTSGSPLDAGTAKPSGPTGSN